MLQVKLFSAESRESLETEVNEYLSKFHRAVSPRDIRVSLTQYGDAAPHETGWYWWATLTYETMRADLATEPTKGMAPPPDSSHRADRPPPPPPPPAVPPPDYRT